MMAWSVYSYDLEAIIFEQQNNQNVLIFEKISALRTLFACKTAKIALFL